ncbi:MAG TPA: NlpC/P60 family protein [Campylobacterales bacterium]|nr:NlpC/P60 family protein [Campylobacterales bacterium]
MRNLKRFSMVLLAAPALFIGCSNTKTASLKPKEMSNKIVQVDANKSVSKQDKLLASAIYGGEISLEEVTTPKTKIETTTKTLTKQSLKLDQTWEAFTKEDEVLETAKKYLGVKYIWAANGPSAFDCSGFTKYVFKKNGISLPRHSGHQANIGKKVKFKDLQKGDLVFFDTTKKFTRTVNHVGIFIGDNKFIHASSGGKKVMITSFEKKKFYKNKFLYARRVIDHKNTIVLETTLQKKSSVN